MCFKKRKNYPITVPGSCCSCGRNNHTKTHYKVPVDKALRDAKVWASVVGSKAVNNAENRNKMEIALAQKGLDGMTICEDCVKRF